MKILSDFSLGFVYTGIQNYFFLDTSYFFKCQMRKIALHFSTPSVLGTSSGIKLEFSWRKSLLKDDNIGLYKDNCISYVLPPKEKSRFPDVIKSEKWWHQ